MRKVIITLVSVAMGAIGLVAGAGTALAASGGTVITVANTPFGKALVVGSGTYKGYSLYDITSDHPPSYGCPATAVPLPPVFPPGFTCTGPSNDKNAEWPAITTNGAPVAGPGVKASLLGSVYGRASAARSPTTASRCTCSTSSRARSPAKDGMSPAFPRGTECGSWSSRTATSSRGRAT